MNRPRISLDPFRTAGVRVFSGFGRGAAVGEAIRVAHPGEIDVEVPDDVFYIERHFWAGLVSAHRGAVLPWVAYHRSLVSPGPSPPPRRYP